MARWETYKVGRTIAGAGVYGLVADDQSFTTVSEEGNKFYIQYSRLNSKISAEAFYVINGGEFTPSGLLAPINEFDFFLGYTPPSLGFVGDIDTGIRGDGFDGIIFTAGGLDVVTISSSNTVTFVPKIEVPLGTLSSPSVKCAFDTDTGINFTFDNPNTMQLVAGGALVADVGRDGIRIGDKCEAEAFYLTQGGDVFAYDFNQEHFYITPAKSNIGRKVVNLDVFKGLQSKSINVESPTSAEDIAWFFTEAAVTVSKVRSVLRGTTPSVTFGIYHNTDRSAAGNNVFSTNQASTSTTVGDSPVPSGDPTIPANSHVWIETSAASGTIAEWCVTAFFTED